jgi:ring-1,2-phenylacetyl-CoA epoxidase subunit PaaE
MTSTRVAFASEGGIVPALDVVSRLLTESPGQHVWLFCGHAVGEHPEALEQALALKDRHLSRLSLGVVMDREPDEAELLSGQLDGPKVQALASRLFDAKAVSEYIVCGSDKLAADVRTALGTLGVDPRRIRVECLGEAKAAPGAPYREAQSAAVSPALGSPAIEGSSNGASAAPSTNETLVSFVMDGRRRSFPMRTGDESILDAAGRAGIELPFSCKAGVCSTCRTKLVRGEVEMAENYALEDWELEQGFILACQSHAKTPEIELTYDET